MLFDFDEAKKTFICHELPFPISGLENSLASVQMKQFILWVNIKVFFNSGLLVFIVNI